MSNLRELDDGTIQKQCKVCREWKRIPEGYVLAVSCADGFSHLCRSCDTARKQEYLASRPLEKKKEQSDRNAKWNYRNGKSNEHLW